jgi:hypothetical protein
MVVGEALTRRMQAVTARDAEFAGSPPPCRPHPHYGEKPGPQTHSVQMRDEFGDGPPYREPPHVTLRPAGDSSSSRIPLT